MCGSGHANCCVLDTHEESPRGERVNRREESDAHGFVSAGMAAIQLFPIGSMAIAYESIALTVGTVKDDCYH